MQIKHSQSTLIISISYALSSHQILMKSYFDNFGILIPKVYIIFCQLEFQLCKFFEKPPKQMVKNGSEKTYLESPVSLKL